MTLRPWPAISRRWRRRSLRARLTITTALPLSVALIAGAIAVVAVFTSGRLHDLDRQTRAESQSLVDLLSTGQIPVPLPAPAGSPLFAQVIDSAGTVLAATGGASRVLALTETGSTPRTLGSRTETSGSYAGVPLRLRVTATSLNDAPVYVVVAAPLSDVHRAQRALRLVLLLVAPVLITAGASLAWVIIGLALRPVEELRVSAARLAKSPGERAQLPQPEGDDEITRLSATLNELLLGLGTAIARQRDFVADAAHELRSPLASMRVQLDVAARHPEMLTTELLEGLSLDVERLSTVADDLILLARLDSKLPLRIEHLDLTELVGESGPPLVVDVDSDAIRRVLRNLLDNARRYSETVRLSTEARDDTALLIVDDDGPGIPEPERTRVFERWVRLDQSRARSAGGSGLGLALVREIAHAHGGEVEIHDSPLGGTRVIVALPLASQRSEG